MSLNFFNRNITFKCLYIRTVSHYRFTKRTEVSAATLWIHTANRGPHTRSNDRDEKLNQTTSFNAWLCNTKRLCKKCSDTID